MSGRAGKTGARGSAAACPAAAPPRMADPVLKPGEEATLQWLRDWLVTCLPPGHVLGPAPENALAITAGALREQLGITFPSFERLREGEEEEEGEDLTDEQLNEYYANKFAKMFKDVEPVLNAVKDRDPAVIETMIYGVDAAIEKLAAEDYDDGGDDGDDH